MDREQPGTVNLVTLDERAGTKTVTVETRRKVELLMQEVLDHLEAIRRPARLALRAVAPVPAEAVR